MLQKVQKDSNIQENFNIDATIKDFYELILMFDCIWNYEVYEVIYLWKPTQ